MKLSVVLPAFNAEKSLSFVIDSIRTYFDDDIIVVDDGSTDATSQIAKNAGAIVLSHKHNCGKGEALKTGFRKAMGMNCRAVITIDADGQHNPRFIPALIKAYKAGKGEIIIGSRLRNVGSMPFHRLLSNKITSGMISLRINSRVSDSQCGYRIIDADVLRRIKLITSRFDTESELLLKAGLIGCRIADIEIDSTYSDEPSSIRHLNDTWRFIKLYLISLTW